MKFQLLLGSMYASFAGIEYEAVDGVIDAPAEAAEAFASLGILPISEPVTPAAPAAPAAKATLSVDQVKASITADTDLDALEAAEKEGANRKGVFEAIEAARKARIFEAE